MAAQSAIENNQNRLKVQQGTIDENERHTTTLRVNIDNQQKSLDEVHNKIVGFSPQLEQLQKQLDALRNQEKTIIVQSNENRLNSDFATFAKGTTSLTVDRAVYKAPDNPSGKPVVYLTSYESITSDHDMNDIHRFADSLAVLDYKFIHGDFALHRGQNATAGNLVPNSYCTQVIYYNASYEQAAKQVANAIASSFHLPVPLVKLVPISSTQIDPVSKTVIEMSGVNVAAAVAIPSASTCSIILSQY